MRGASDLTAAAIISGYNGGLPEPQQMRFQHRDHENTLGDVMVEGDRHLWRRRQYHRATAGAGRTGGILISGPVGMISQVHPNKLLRR